MEGSSSMFVLLTLKLCSLLVISDVIRIQVFKSSTYIQTTYKMTCNNFKVSETNSDEQGSTLSMMTCLSMGQILFQIYLSHLSRHLSKPSSMF